MELIQRPRRLRGSETLRKMVRETRMDKSSLIYPLFVKEGTGIEEEIPSMEGQYRYSVDRLPFELERLAKAGVSSVMLFGIPDHKDEVGSGAYASDGIVDFVPKIIRGFLSANEGKNINFNLYCDKVLTADILTGLKEKKYDLGFCSNIGNEPLIEFTPVASQELVVITPLDHPLAQKEEIRLEETLPYKQIIFKKRSGLRQIIDGLFDQIGQKPEVSYEIDEDQVAVGFVANGFGICVAPDIPIIHSLDIKILPLVSPCWQRNFYMAMLKGVYHPPVVEAFKKYVIEHTSHEWDYKTS